MMSMIFSVDEKKFKHFISRNGMKVNEFKNLEKNF